MKKKVVEIPPEFQCEPFFKESETKIVYTCSQSFEELIQNTYFLFDIEQKYQPWRKVEKSIPAVLQMWADKKENLSKLFKERKRNEAKAPMVHFSAYLLSILYWMNEKRISSLKDIKQNTEKLKLQPVNFMERYTFIIEQPNHYHSYIQLTQLYIEIEKIYAKNMMIKKKSLS
ncbi:MULTISPECIES: YpoC family protein [unclassified Bacillus cereus group]|uniref:YpoC family protein n=1 Tax=unclassified Bacillus cereus group TaxID=2750818 RepID=UPI001F598D19|nr:MULTISPECIES: GTPase [unclassified Bacillus cereus group]